MPAAALADLLRDPARVGASVGREVLDAARGVAERAAADAVRLGGWTPAEPLRLSKGPLGWLVRCPRRALADDPGGSPDDLAIGLIVDAGAKLASLSPTQPVTVEASLGLLAAEGDSMVTDVLASMGGEGAAQLRSQAEVLLDRLLAAWPAIDEAWWPRVDDPVRVRFAGGAITVSGRLDILLGGPPTGRPGLAVEIKSGRWHDELRRDAHLYALLLGLRDGETPAGVLTIAVGDGTTVYEPIRPAVVEHAVDLVAMAVTTAAGLAAGAVPETRPGTHCGFCPLRAECEPGQRWLLDAAGAER